MKSMYTLVALAAIAVAGATQAAGVPGQGTWETTLLGRDTNGHAVAASSSSAVFLYDTALDVTWLRDADVNGLIDWSAANTWANSLLVGAYSGWRLPTLRPVNGTSFQDDFSNNGSTDWGTAKTDLGWGVASEMGHLFYVTLGNKGYFLPNDSAPGDSSVIQSGYGLSNTGTFLNVEAHNYWSGVQYACGATTCARSFTFSLGSQNGAAQVVALSAMAVRPGDVLVPVPELQSLAMMLAGLGVLFGAVRPRKHA